MPHGLNTQSGRARAVKPPATAPRCLPLPAAAGCAASSPRASGSWDAAALPPLLPQSIIWIFVTGFVLLLWVSHCSSPAPSLLTPPLAGWTLSWGLGDVSPAGGPEKLVVLCSDPNVPPSLKAAGDTARKRQRIRVEGQEQSFQGQEALPAQAMLPCQPNLSYCRSVAICTPASQYRHVPVPPK